MPAKDTVDVRLDALNSAQKKSGLNNKSLAQLAGVSASSVGRIIKSGRASTENIEAIEAALGVPQGTFYVREDDGILPMPGVLEWIEKNRAELKITKQEAWQLRQTRFKAPEWVEIDDRFWRKMLLFWRDYLGDANSP